MIIPSGTEVLPVTTRGHTMNQAHVAAPRPAPLHPPDPGPKVKRASPGPTARLKTSTRPPAPRNSLWDDLHPAPTLDPCPGHALAPGPGLDASPEDTDRSSKALLICLRMFLFSFWLWLLESYALFAFVYHHIMEESVAKAKRAAGAEIFLALWEMFLFWSD